MKCPTDGCDVITTTRFCPDCGTRIVGEKTEKFWRGEMSVAELVEQAAAAFYSKSDG